MSYGALFKSPEAEEKFLTVYNASLDLWPVPHEALDVETDFGRVHINAAGSADLPPLLLLHGAAVNSTWWYPNIAPLSESFRVYAPDLLHQTGLSVAHKRQQNPQDTADWLNQLLGALKIERASLVGHSYGGWLALNYALSVPQRVERLVLLAPAPAFTSVRWQVFLRMMPVFFRPTQRSFYRFFEWASTIPLNEEHILIEQFVTAIKSINPQSMAIMVNSVFTDEELRGLKPPAFLLIGENEVVYKAAPVIERARGLIPDIDAELVANAGHLVPIEQAAQINERMLAFLKR